MSKKTDQHYLLHEQYKDATNLNARAQLHERFSTNKENWFRWVFDHFHLPYGAHILELGTGPALLWQTNLDRIPEDWQITLTDFSPGMLHEASKNLGDLSAVTFEIVDAQAIPFDAELFDVVIANHMLYHVPDLAKALAEIRRVLKPEGYFYAATNGIEHMREISAFGWQIVPENSDTSAHSTFTLENGAEWLSQQFSHIELYRTNNSLEVTEVEPLMAYILSTRAGTFLVDEKQAALRSLLEQELAKNGAIHITRSSGLFEAYGPKE
jgi:ubiquinone/menaquinone biosynthesis C-methylase UbiE